MVNSLVTAGGVYHVPVNQPAEQIKMGPPDRRVIMYRADEGGHEAREFASPEDVPKGAGWVDHPGKVGAPSVPEMPPPAAQPAPQTPPAAGMTYDELLADNARLLARVAELEALLDSDPLALPAEHGLPPAPGEGPSVRDILGQAGPPLEPDIEGLRSQARELGIRVDNRWGVQRLQAEIAAVSNGN